MQIHELNNFSGTLGSGAYLAVDDGTDTGKLSTQGLLASTEARIDNLVSSVTVDSEVIDARYGADGVTYPSLGAAIRTQVSDLKDDINYLIKTQYLTNLITPLDMSVTRSYSSGTGGRIDLSGDATVESGVTYFAYALVTISNLTNYTTGNLRLNAIGSVLNFNANSKLAGVTTQPLANGQIELYGEFTPTSTGDVHLTVWRNNSGQAYSLDLKVNKLYLFEGTEANLLEAARQSDYASPLNYCALKKEMIPLNTPIMLGNGNSSYYNGSVTINWLNGYKSDYKCDLFKYITSTATGVKGILAGMDKPINVITSSGKEAYFSMYVKLKNENTSVVMKPLFSSTNAWGGNNNRLEGEVITVRKSGMYTVKAKSVYNSSDDAHKKYTYFLIDFYDYNQCLEIQNIDYVSVFVDYIDDVNKTYNFDLLFWGDSLTAGAGGNGTTYPRICALELGLSYTNCGVGGETANTIAARQGGNNVIIPAGAINGNYSSLTDIFGASIAPLLQGNGANSGNELYINGEKCSLSYSAGTYTISGYTGGTSSVPLLGRFAGSDFTGDIVVIFVGQNGAAISGLTELESRIAIIDSMIKHIGHNRYVILGLSSGTNDSRASDDRTMLAHYGNKFFPTRKLLVENGLTINGLTPTAQDTTDISNGTVPTSLRYDHVHLNAYGYTALGKMLADKIKSLGYV